MNRTIIVTVAFTLFALAAGGADQWPQFRGMQAGIAADVPVLPDIWSETSNVVWKTDIPGLGWSSPIVWNEQVFVTSAISGGEQQKPSRGLFDPLDSHGRTKASAVHRWMVYAIDLKTGKTQWERELRNGPPPIFRQAKNSYASETPVTDGE